MRAHSGSAPTERPVTDQPQAGTGRARPAAAASAGPSSLPINHLAEDPSYAAGSGQLTDPLSCM